MNSTLPLQNQGGEQGVTSDLIGGGRDSRPVFLQVFKPFAGFVQLSFDCGDGGFGWGVNNVIHIAPMPETLVFTVFCVFVQHTSQRMWNKTRCHKRPCLSRPCPKHRYLKLFASLHNILHKDVEQGKLLQASMPLATMPKILVFTAFLFLTFCGLRNPG